MNSREFAKTWLEQEGLCTPESEYDGLIGTWTMEIVELIASQGHSGASAHRVLATLDRLYEAYSNPEHPIWQAFWQSNEGKKLIAESQKGV